MGPSSIEIPYSSVCSILVIAASGSSSRSAYGRSSAPDRDPDMVRMLGISLKPVSLPFRLGVGLAAISGVLASPCGVEPAMGTPTGHLRLVVVSSRLGTSGLGHRRPDGRDGWEELLHLFWPRWPTHRSSPS